MITKRYLLDYEVEAHGCLEDDSEIIQSLDSTHKYEIHIKNLKVNSGIAKPLLSIQLILSAKTIEEAEQLGELYFSEYLNTLMLVTHLLITVHRLVRIIDWTVGIKKRECIQYELFTGLDLPNSIITKDHVSSVETLLKPKLNLKIRRSLSWFRTGVNAEFIEDQFQFFWFAIEVLSSFYKETTKVNDLCAQCRSPLYCENCKDFPLHRPYPKQAINQLISKFEENDSLQLFTTANEVRNALMHGDTVTEIEKSLQISLENVADDVGQVAWKAIISAIMQSFEEEEVPKNLLIKLTDSYSRQVMKARMRLFVFSKDPDNPILEELAKPVLNLIDPEGKNAEKI